MFLKNFFQIGYSAMPVKVHMIVVMK